MPSTPSISKESILSTTTTNISSHPTPETPSQNLPNFPPSHPQRKLYLLLRSTAISLSLIQLTAVTIAAAVFGLKRWLDPSLSPAVTTLIYSGIDAFSVLKWDGRSHYLTRAIYDGIIAVAFVVSAGFLGRIAFGVGDGKGVGGEVLGGVIFGCMLCQVVVHGVVSVEGVKDAIRIRRLGEGGRFGV